MPEPEEIEERDFDAQMRGLFEQAEQVLERQSVDPSPAGGAGHGPRSSPDFPASPNHAPSSEAGSSSGRPRGAYPNLPQMLRPLVLGLEAMTRATGENTSLLNKLDKAVDASAEAQHGLPQLIAELRALLELKSGVNQRMFDALHEELKDYKDDFLLESVHRPVIRDLITLYDDLVEIHRQMATAVVEATEAAELGPSPQALMERMQTLATNIEHKMDFIIEVLARLEVTPLLAGTGKLDKVTQRAVALESAETAEEDGDVVRSVKRGFSWKNRVVRAEEVVVKKWKDGSLTTMPTPSEK